MSSGEPSRNLLLAFTTMRYGGESITRCIGDDMAISLGQFEQFSMTSNIEEFMRVSRAYLENKNGSSTRNAA
ncbi:hypothetical protein BSFA1_10430 [Burkholderia sp. SFA1]|nr:hypothetical protein BSFA1_10430 [Burkholderia sp. SFA1]